MGFITSSNMRIFLAALLPLVVLMGGRFTAADPAIHRDTQSGDWCREHRILHKRIELVEEQVEKTVEYLYSEVNSLLDTLSKASWALPSSPGAPLLDMFEEDSR
ncbi:hypothetical protein GDO86_013084 [Hymenochirus boettgeri]|uniref:Placenta-specific protein 9 n=1 Tax=Hymenochirus boettgeri TaxID=247094 RepID=A0A8T2IVC7_9PIPI|nr:hypothetical protein GDO86_013084 [Hymenochirus boettgeri]